jgi:hypothetical protein
MGPDDINYQPEQSLLKILRNEGLVDSVASIPGIDRDIYGSSIYYGTGLTTSKALSAGLPFDVLGMVLAAEKLRRTLGLEHIYHHIADTHALTNAFATAPEVQARAGTVEATMGRVATHLGIKDRLTVFKSSSFDGTPEYTALLDTVVTGKNDYVRRELADMRWYREKHGAAMKLGWVVQTTPSGQGFDERMFDNEYQNCFGKDLMFVYLRPGRTFDKSRPRAAPYISVPDEQRILLKAGEDVEAKVAKAKALWPDKTLGGALNHLAAIIRTYDQIAPEPSGQGAVTGRIQTIIDRIFQ